MGNDGNEITDTEESTRPVQTDSSRRSFLKSGIALTAVPLALTAYNNSEAQVAPPTLLPSPSTANYAWQIDLPISSPLAKTVLNNPPPTGEPDLAGGECGRDKHQRWDSFYQYAVDHNRLDTYEIRVREAQHTFTLSPNIPPQPIWGFNGLYPGPTIHAYYGRPAIVRFYNELPQNHVGFGSPEISVHLHNLHGASESDGFPGDYFSPIFAGPTLTSPGKFRDHFYYNVRAGYDEMPDTWGDPNESLGTLWFHDHTLDSTAGNVYRGLAGFYLLFDELDSGNEKDPNPKALRLPSGDYDIPIVIQDKRFSPDGKLYWNQLSPEGVIGDKYVVNGVIQPKLSVEPRKYRFRFLNGGPTRSYELYFIVRNTSTKQSFQYIANDGNLLTAPLPSNQLHNPNGPSPHGIHLGAAERADIVFDFSRYPTGTEIMLINRLKQNSTRKPEKDLLSIGGINTNPSLFDHQLMLIRIDKPLKQPDNSKVKAKLRPMTPIPTNLEDIPVRKWEFDRKSGVWMVNDRTFDVDKARAKVKKGDAEIWELKNNSGGWTHPIHIHLEEGRIISRSDGDRNFVAPQERGRKDVYVLHPGHTLRIFIRFRDFTGKYVMHCHNLAHEDHHMMVRFDVEEA